VNRIPAIMRAALFTLSMVAICGLLAIAPRAAKAQSTGAHGEHADAQAAKSDSASAAKIENGKKLFTSDGCYECHGRMAQGGTGPRLGPDPIPFSAFLQYVRHPAGSMPPFTSKVVSDAEFEDIYAFISSLPQPPKAKDLPLLNQ
jgi:mono/diheme cytochrome c family protein